MWRQSSCTQNFLGPFSLTVMLLVVSTPTAADVCVWRNPERTMTRLFPEAHDYTMVTVKITQDQVKMIEEDLGSPLDPSETHEMNFYTITDHADQSLGTIMALAGKGEYGAIEVVIGLDLQGQIVGAYVQQSRERATAAIKAPSFLAQFAGKRVHDPLMVGRDLTSAQGAERASAVVAATIRKMLLFHDAMLKGVSQ